MNEKTLVKFGFPPKTSYESKINDVATVRYGEDNVVYEIELEEIHKEVLKGNWGEQKFKDILDKNDIPSLYISQGVNDFDYSSGLYQKKNLKRPDFFVSFPNSIAGVFVDVKVRSVIDNKYFYIAYDDYSKLKDLHEEIHVPVWVVFLKTEEYRDSEKKESPEFYICPIDLLEESFNLSKDNGNDLLYFISLYIPEDSLGVFGGSQGKINHLDVPLKLCDESKEQLNTYYKNLYEDNETLKKFHKALKGHLNKSSSNDKISEKNLLFRNYIDVLRKVFSSSKEYKLPPISKEEDIEKQYLKVFCSLNNARLSTKEEDQSFYYQILPEINRLIMENIGNTDVGYFFEKIPGEKKLDACMAELENANYRVPEYLKNYLAEVLEKKKRFNSVEEETLKNEDAPSQSLIELIETYGIERDYY